MKPYPFANGRQELTFAAGSTTSSAVTMHAAWRGLAVEGVSIDNWTAADAAIQVSVDGTTWKFLRDNEGARITVPVGEDVRAGDPEAWFIAPFSYIRLVSVSTADPEATVEQVAASTLALVFTQ